MAVPLPNRGDTNYDEVLNAGIWQVETESIARDDALEQRITHDTGWVDIYADLADQGWDGSALIRRQANRVELRITAFPGPTIDGTPRSPGGSFIISADSDGYAPSFPGTSPNIIGLALDANNDVHAIGVIGVPPQLEVQHAPSSAVTGNWDAALDFLQFTVSWMTDDDFPVIIP